MYVSICFSTMFYQKKGKNIWDTVLESSQGLVALGSSVSVISHQICKSGKRDVIIFYIDEMTKLPKMTHNRS